METQVNGPSPFELLKQINRIRKDPVDYLQFAAENYGDLVHFRAGTVNAFLLNHPDAAMTVLRDHHQQYDKDTIQYNSLARITGQGLLTNSGKHWLQQRRLIQPAFSRQKLAAIEPFAAAAAQSAVERWKMQLSENPVIDVDREMMYVSLEVVGAALFGTDLREQLKDLVEAVLVALDHIMLGAKNLVVLPTFIPTRGNRHFKEALTTLDQAIDSMLARRKSIGLGDDLLSMLIEAQIERGKDVLPDRQIRDEIITLLIAGHETVATALTWTWYLLSQHPQARDRLFAEVDLVLAGELPSLEKLDDLKFTLQVFQESLRLYPPAWMITRRALQQDIVKDLEIPKDSLIIISPYTMHRHPDFWNEPEKFDPERFGEANLNNLHKFAYIPFGGGPALCIGKNFALIEAQIIMAIIAQHFQLDLEADQKVEMDALVTLRPKSGMHMHLVPRMVD